VQNAPKRRTTRDRGSAGKLSTVIWISLAWDFLRSWVLWAATRFAPKEQVVGIELASLAGDDAADVMVLARYKQALLLIGRHDPRRLRALARALRRVVVISGGGGYFLPPLRAFVADVGLASKEEILDLAIQLVHEGTHARLHAAGCRYTSASAERHERACIEQEVRFLRRINGTEDLVKARLALLDKPWWTPEAIARHNRATWERIQRIFARPSRRT
jgi:hypothetical protein